MISHFKITIPKEEHDTEPWSRRAFCRKVGDGMALAVVPIIFAACAERKSSVATDEIQPDCNDYSDLMESDLKLRESLAYVDESPLPESTCINCNLWLPMKGKSDCGGCTLFKGGVRPQGYCTYWAPQEQ